MKVAIDKNSVNIAKKNGNEYIYLFDNEKLDELLKTIRLLHKNEIGYAVIEK